MSIIQPQTPWNQCRTQEKNSSRLSEDEIVKLLTSDKWQKARIRNTEYSLMDVDEYLQGNSEMVQRNRQWFNFEESLQGGKNV